jgi:DNA invertase Pin-like site-specific DNA recombinase
VLAIEASRLARNGRDWHTLVEFCAFLNSLIIDEDGIYNPRLVNDRLLFGLKGTFSELESSIFRQRSQEALRMKAALGELYTTVAIGYRRSADRSPGTGPRRADPRGAVSGVPQIQRYGQRAPTRPVAAPGGD